MACVLKRSLLVLTLLTGLSSMQGMCQSGGDSAYVSDQKAGTSARRHSPRTATLLSMAVPGLGQIYNRKNAWWKVPIIYAAGGGLVYAAVFYHNSYTEFRGYYKYALEHNLTSYEVPGYGAYFTPTIKTIRDNYRSDRDMMIIFTALLYTIQVVDASVEAHFLDFNVSDNLSLNVQPGIQPYAASDMAYGVRLTLNLK